VLSKFSQEEILPWHRKRKPKIHAKQIRFSPLNLQPVVNPIPSTPTLSHRK
ncbi:unnamed protein product, partial [Nesidiocoris tenuis]